jgi:2-keto-4-pentenoate hydratase
MSTTDEAASILAALWRSGEQATDFPPALKPASLNDGYDIQDRFVATLGETLLGWKLGVGSHKGKRETGIGRAIAGRVLGSRCYRAGETVRLPDRAPVTIEFEIAFVLGRDIRPDEDPGAVMSAVAETKVTFELVRSRFVNRRVIGWPSFAADNAGFEALVVGSAVDPAQIDAIASTVVVSVDGVDRARALTGEDVTDPYAAMTGFAALARERGMILPKGAIISTGTVTQPFNIEGAVAITARYLDTEIGFQTGVA